MTAVPTSLAASSIPDFPNTAPVEFLDDAMLCAVAIDAEEDFDWQTPVLGTPHTTDCMRHMREAQVIFGAYGLVPTYLLTYPVLDDPGVVRILQRYLERGECDVGIQLHPWVTPPLEGPARIEASYCGNLPPGLEARKLQAICAKFQDVFGRAPHIYRAGRYGLSGQTAALLEEEGFLIDTSLAPYSNLTADGGPDYSEYSSTPFWFGRQRRILELPLCRGIAGWGGSMAPGAYRAFARRAPAGIGGFRMSGIVTRSRFAERITLSPEGNDLRAMRRLVRHLRDVGERILVVSFHSSSFVQGTGPYVRTKPDLHEFYDRLSGILDYIARQCPVRFVSLAEIPSYLRRPEP